MQAQGGPAADHRARAATSTTSTLAGHAARRDRALAGGARRDRRRSTPPRRSSAPASSAVLTGEDMASDFAGAAADGLGAARRRDQDARAPAAGKRGEVKHVGDPVAVVVATDRYTRRGRRRGRDRRVRPEAGGRRSRGRARGRLAARLGGVRHQQDARVGRRRRRHRRRRSPRPTSSSSTASSTTAPSGAPIEPRGSIGELRGDKLTLYSTTQIPHIARFVFSGMLGMPEDQLRVVAPDVGGGFGAKLQTYGEEVLVARAREAAGPAGEVDRDALGAHDDEPPRPRPDQLRDAGREARRDGHRAPREDRRRPRRLPAAAHAVHPGARLPGDGRLLPDPERSTCTSRACSRTRWPPTRSAAPGGPEATYWIELMMDRLADELGMDRLELRRKNFIPSDEFPYETALGIFYDSGNYEGALDRLLEHFDLDDVPCRAGASCASEGVYRGVGFSTYVEVCGLAPSRAVGPQGVGLQAAFWESANVRVTPTGSATVYTGTSPHGQGLDTSFAQIAGRRLGIDPENVDVHPRRHRPGPVGLGHLRLALARGRRRGDRARRASGCRTRPSGSAPRCSRRRPRTSSCVDGKYQVRGSPDKSMTMAEISRRGAHPAERAAGRHRAGARGERVLRPGELRVPVRRARVRGRRGRRDRQGRRWCATSRSTTAARRSTRC